MGSLTIGVLGLQGAVDPHLEILNQLGASAVSVLKPDQLVGLSGIILPGGESSAMIHLLKEGGLWEPLKVFVRERPAWGICAGAILLARTVYQPRQISLEAMDIDVERNAYGRQIQSFRAALTRVDASEDRFHQPLEVLFIRAPRITRVGDHCRVLFTQGGDPVLVEAGGLMAATFHAELTRHREVHGYFMAKCQNASNERTTSDRRKTGMAHG